MANQKSQALTREPYVHHDGQWEHLPSRYQAKPGKPELIACPNCGARWKTDDLKWEYKDCINCGRHLRKTEYWLAVSADEQEAEG